ncbi:MAG: methyltransferase, partial [Nitrospinota bacterium]
MSHFFKNQVLHLVLLVVLLGITGSVGSRMGFGEARLLGLGVRAWFLLSLALPVLHQVFVWVVWRWELCRSGVSRAFGPNGFMYYAILFSVLGLSRVAAIVGLGVVDRQTLALHPAFSIAAIVLLTPPAAYTFYSVARFFGFRRAFGIDHFDETYRDKPLVRRGIFRYTRNGMYKFGFLVFWIIGIAFASRLALLVAFFNHAYVWVHYYCTERPDMERIYGDHR